MCVSMYACVCIYIQKSMETQVGEEEVEEKMVVVLAAEEDEEESEEQPLMSTLTLERVGAAKKFIQDHYKTHMELIQQRKERSFFTFTYILLFGSSEIKLYVRVNFYVPEETNGYACIYPIVSTNV